MSKAKPKTPDQIRKQRRGQAALRKAKKLVAAADAEAQIAEVLDETPKWDHPTIGKEPVEEEVVKKVPTKVKSKKGRQPWKPANLLTVNGKTDGFRYRWTNNNDRNLAKKAAEGWVKVSQTTGIPGSHDRPDNTIDGGPMCSDGVEYLDTVLMALPEETALERDKYQAELVRAQTQSNLVDKVQEGVKNIGGSGMTAKLHGNISFD